MLPKISVFLPTYQQVDLVGEAIDSVLIQDYPNLEVVVSDDGSTDGTADVLKDYDRRHPGLFKVLLSETNTGITANCNRAYAACTGEFTAYFSGDDVWLPGKLHKQIEWFAGNPDAVICYTNAEIFDGASGRTLHLQHEPHRNPFRDGGVGQLFLSTTFFCGATVMVRRSACPPHGYDTRLKHCSDWLFWVETARNGQIGFLEDTTTRYRMHPGNITKRSDLMLQDQRAALDIVEERYPDLRLFVKRLRGELLWTAGMKSFRTGDIEHAASILQEAFSTGHVGSQCDVRLKRWMVRAAVHSNNLPRLYAVRDVFRKLRGKA